MTTAAPPEAPYRMDAAMKAMCTKYWLAEVGSRFERAVELSRRMFAAAGAAGWPPHSLALAQLRVRLLHSLIMARIGHGDTGWKWRQGDEQLRLRSPLPNDEETALVAQAYATLRARLDAGTLLSLTPSERAFEDDWELARMQTDDDSATASLPCLPQTQQPIKHALGYNTAISLAQKLAMRVFQSFTNADCITFSSVKFTVSPLDEPRVARCFTRHVADEVPMVVRLLSLVRAVRCAPQGLRSRRLDNNELVMMDMEATPDEVRLMGLMHQYIKQAEASAWYPRAMERTGQQLLLAQLRAAWRDAAETFGPKLCAGGAAVYNSFMNTDIEINEAARQSWQPRACAQCGAREAEPKLFKVCSRCAGAAYCCKEHQTEHWPTHKAACKAASKAAASS